MNHRTVVVGYLPLASSPSPPTVAMRRFGDWVWAGIWNNFGILPFFKQLVLVDRKTSCKYQKTVSRKTREWRDYYGFTTGTGVEALDRLLFCVCKVGNKSDKRYSNSSISQSTHHFNSIRSRSIGVSIVDCSLDRFMLCRCINGYRTRTYRHSHWMTVNLTSIVCGI